jgi:hypothetical protein
MRTQIFLLGGVILLLMIGCKAVDKLTQFNMDFNSSVVIPVPSGIDLPSNINTPDVVTNSESTFAVKDTRKDMIEEVKLTSLQLTITLPSDGNFDFMKTINVYMSAEGLPETKIAWKENISNGIGSVLELDTSNEDLKEYIKKDKFVMRLNTVTDELITTEHHIDIHSVFFVDARILGQ